MIIKELNLIGFGKFKNQVIKLKNGINIIYGENEGGKSTIHSFIDGMFYGFLRPYVKSTLYTEEHKKYEPWNSDRYAGILKFISNGEDYRIERNFTKGKEETKVFLENTAEDITYKINNGTNGRVLQPGIHFMGFENSVFSNTVSIKQLGSRTDVNLANEVRDKLVNITSSLDDNIYVERAIKELDKAIKEIGTEKATTSTYGKLSIQLSNLLIEKEHIHRCKTEYEKLLDDNNEIVRKLEGLEKQLKSEKELLNLVLLKEKKDVYDEALKIESRLTELEENIEKYHTYRGLSNDDYLLATKINNEIQIISNRIEDINSQAEELNKAINEESFKIKNNDDNNIKDISNDYLEIDALEDDKNKLIYANGNTQKEFIIRDYESIKNKASHYKIAIAVIGILYLVLMVVSLLKNNFYFSVSFQVLLIPIIVLMIKYKNINKVLAKKDIELMYVEREEKSRKQSLEEIVKRQQIILEKYNFTSKIQLKNLYNSLQHSQYIRDEKLKTIVENRNKVNHLNNKADSLTLEQNKLIIKISEILAKYSVSNLKDFEIGLEKKKIYDDSLVEYHTKKELLRKVLGVYTLVQLEVELVQQHFEMDLLITEDKEIIQNRIDKITEDISNVRIDKKGIEERINLLIPEISKLVDIEEDIERSKVTLLKLDDQKKSLELAKSTIEELSKDIQDQFAPEINVKVGSLIKRITNGVYSGVRINDKLDIGVIKPDTGELINVDVLSGGTIDQLYFSLRFGIINFINGDSLPLILDDCFVQYDDIRLSNILKLLEEISQDRQVILFSCHNREKDLLSNFGIEFNLVTLR
ncbi:AAA family ATPase [Tissierella sp. Yu-01]|uniref:ATP-binding protein n=1 Tax=Tissierella sp. Yu-01 TaxID=3035694 RepID=UPI00240D6246|nr:AAA family ATPase [Tissierella sp. Yu-01]WFA09952.1 AAA family ATPase [Tissierella sp. Yu-01]